MSAEAKIRELFKDEFRMKVLRASVPEFVLLVELMLEEISSDRAKAREAESINRYNEMRRLKDSIVGKDLRSFTGQQWSTDEIKTMIENKLKGL